MIGRIKFFQSKVEIAPHFLRVGEKVIIKNHPPEETNRLLGGFKLAPHFSSTFNTEKQPWRKTQHRLFVAYKDVEPIGFAGIEVGDGETIQAYIGEGQDILFSRDKKLAFLHALEVAPPFRGRGIQALLWQDICMHALEHQLSSIVFQPIDEAACLLFFAKYNIFPQQHFLSQFMMRPGADSNKPRFTENRISIFHLKKKDIQAMHEGLARSEGDLQLDKQTIQHYIK